MMGSRRIETARAAIAALLCLGYALGASADPVLSPRDIELFPPAEGKGSFRFLPGGTWAAFDRIIILSAAPSESRSYILETRKGEGEAASVSYTIDKRPPAAPQVSPPGGISREDATLAIQVEKDARASWSLVGPDGASGSFEPYDPADPPRLRVPDSGSATYTLVAYAQDEAGNRSAPTRAVYRLARSSLPLAAFAEEAVLALIPDPALAPPSSRASPGYVELSMAIPSGKRLLLSIAPPAPPSRAEDFAEAPTIEGIARFSLPVPYGWSGEIPVYFGLADERGGSYNPRPLSLSLSYLPEPKSPRNEPAEPILVSDASGRGAFLFFGTYDGEIFVSIDGSRPEPYRTPIALAPGSDSLRVAWYGTGASGDRSAERNIVLRVPGPAPAVSVSGAQEGSTLGQGVVLIASGAAEIRYELRLDGSAAPEPGASSPIFPPSLDVSCSDGSEAVVSLRYRAFDGGMPGESSALSFRIDRRPPLPPHCSETPPPYTDEPRSLSILGSEGETIYVSVSADGVEGPFVPTSAPIDLPGKDSGPVAYSVRAYAVDGAGNRSREMPSLSVVVDRSSVYAADDAPEGGDGSPARPLRSLDSALATAARDGKKSVHLRGAFTLTRSFSTSDPIEIDGGFAADWTRRRGSRASISLAQPDGMPAFSVEGVALALRGIDLRLDEASSAPALRVSYGTLELEDCAIAASAKADLLLVRADDSTVGISRSTLRASRALSFSAVSATRSAIVFADSVLSASAGVRFFGGFDLDEGSLELKGSLIESSADLGTSLLSLRSSSVSADRCILQASDGGGFLRVGSFAETRGEIRNTKVIVAWGAGATLFEIRGRGPSFRHDTIVAESGKGGALFFDCEGAPPEIWNCILTCVAGGGTLSRSGIAPASGSFVADCVWGFDRLSTGAARIASLAALNALNAGSALYASRPCVAEPPAKTFAASAKGGASLSPDSACIDAALPLEGAFARDFSGAVRPSARGKGSPDIGAEELSEDR